MNERLKGFLWITVSYIVAFVLATMLFYIFVLLGTDQIVSLLIADIGATIIVWAFGLIFDNASFYDPYWSVTPLYLVLLFLIKNNYWNFTNILFLIVIATWAIRLTINWISTFKSIKIEDWRYQNYRKNHPKFWHIINFFGINMMPTLLVFVGLLPAFFMMKYSSGFSPLCIFGAIVVLAGTALELFADLQLKSHLNKNDNSVCKIGLWKYSRHPNYFGEISVWFGVYFMMLAVVPAKFYLGIGAIAMLCLFLFISIPLAEKRQLARRPQYKDYVDSTSRLLFWKSK